MRLLLDTHALLWVLSQPQRLSEKALESILDPEVEILVSAVSAFEISIKFHNGKMNEAAILLQNYEGSLRELSARQLEITSPHALLAGSLPGIHKDPFDRLLAAQSILESIPLVSADRALDSLGIQRYW